MLIPLKEILLKYNLNIKGVIQVGAHWAEEHDIYVGLGISEMIYIEPCKDAFSVLVNKFGSEPNQRIILINCACGELEDEMEMYVSNDNQGQSNSILKPNLHIRQHPEVRFTEKEKVKVFPLDDIMMYGNYYNLLVLDVQGAEGLVLKGAIETLKHIDCIYTECNRGQTYEGNMEIDEMDKYLKPFGFARIETYWPSENWTWGDCIYLKIK